MDYDLDKAKELFAKLEEIDINGARATVAQYDAVNTELAALFVNGNDVAPKTIKCGICKQEGHTARTCKQKPTT